MEREAECRGTGHSLRDEICAMYELNILITAASRRVPLIQSFARALKKLEIPGCVITTDMNNLSPGLYFSDKHYLVPLTNDPEYIPILESIAAAERIGLIVPTIDDELPVFGACSDSFRHKGIRVAVSGERTGLVCNDKRLTSEFFRSKGIPFAETWLPSELDFAGLSYPLFLKPRTGRGSVGAYAIRNERELRFFLDYVPDSVVQEYLPGREFTIDVLADFSGRIVSVVPRERLLIRSGVSDRGRTWKDPGLMELGARVAEMLEIRGPANIQVKWQDGNATLFEVNPRFSGGIPLTIAAGADFPALLIEMCLGREIRPQLGMFTDGLTMSCYEAAIFLPGPVSDEEQSTNRKACGDLMRFISK
jgi:carbamoyl-phosphate synthase large subunit